VHSRYIATMIQD